MPVYPCPECGAQLRPANPVTPGKKLRCPKCETVFAPVRPLAQPARPAAAPADDEEESGGLYGLIETKEDAAAAAQRDAAFTPIKDRFARSARGPAMVHVVKPSTLLLASGIATCVFAIVGGLYAVWPLIFKVEDVQPPQKGKAVVGQSPDKRRFKEPTPQERKEAWLMLGGCVFHFAWGAVVCIGASKMHMLESYPLAMVGGVMALNGPATPAGIYLACTADDPYYLFVGLLIAALPGFPLGMWCIATLRRPDVRAGFAEVKPED